MSKYDIYIEIVPPDQVVNQKFFRFGTKSARAVTGPAKLMYRFLRVWLTLKGTNPTDNAYGTTFPNLFMGQNITKFTDLSDVVTLTLDDAAAQVKAQDKINQAPADERLSSYSVLNFEKLGADGFSVTLELKNQAGSSYKLSLPFTN